VLVFAFLGGPRCATPKSSKPLLDEWIARHNVELAGQRKDDV